MFSFGVVLWELLTLERPWHDDPAAAVNGGPKAGKTNPDQHFRDPVLYVIASVPQGCRLDLPLAQDIKPPLPELPRVDLPSFLFFLRCFAFLPSLRACIP